MKAVLGIDLEFYPLIVELYSAMGFQDAETHLLHVVSSVLPDQSLPELGSDHPITQIQKSRESEGKEHLQKAVELLGGRASSQKVVFGDPARKLIEYAEELQVDLIGVGSTQKGRWASLFEGSVTTALSSGAQQSILVGKHSPGKGSGLTAVFATDHSDYNYRCFDELIRLNPALKKVTVVSATRIENSIREPLTRDMPDAIGSVVQGVVTEIEKRNQALCQRIQSLGIEGDSIFIQKDPTQAIDEVMHDREADLLIVGAQGRNFWERMRLGSVSHHAVVGTPHNVLVMRV